MNKTTPEHVKNIFLEQYEALSKQEREFIHRILENRKVARNMNHAFDEQLTFGQRVADKVAAFGGSWTFIIIFGCILISWIILNSVILTSLNKTFDPFPYILLNLFLSMIAALQAPVIMMSQNRQNAKDRLDAAHDYEVNLKSEVEIASLHEKMDNLREKQWLELLELQQEQIRMLTQLLEEKTGHGASKP